MQRSYRKNEVFEFTCPKCGLDLAVEQGEGQCPKCGILYDMRPKNVTKVTETKPND